MSLIQGEEGIEFRVFCQLAGEEVGGTGGCNIEGCGTKERVLDRSGCTRGSWVRERGMLRCLLRGPAVYPGSLFSAGTPGPRKGEVVGAIGGAGVTALLALCLCLIFFV